MRWLLFLIVRRAGRRRCRRRRWCWRTITDRCRWHCLSWCSEMMTWNWMWSRRSNSLVWIEKWSRYHLCWWSMKHGVMMWNHTIWCMHRWHHWWHWRHVSWVWILCCTSPPSCTLILKPNLKKYLSILSKFRKYCLIYIVMINKQFLQ